MDQLSFNTYVMAFTITLLAGLSTGLGSFVIYSKRQLNHNYLATALGFSAGVMLYLSLIEILPESRTYLEAYFGEELGFIVTSFAFFMGMFLLILINRIIPDPDYFRVNLSIFGSNWYDKDRTKLYRTSLLTLLAIAIHNFPEGLVTFMAGLHNPSLGLQLGLAIAIHNIPEGISVAVPLYYATGDKKRAVKVTFLSGLAEPLGAVIGFLLFRNFVNDLTIGLIFALIAGIMTFISLDELLPVAEDYGEHKYVIRGLMTGMAVIAVSLIL